MMALAGLALASCQSANGVPFTSGPGTHRCLGWLVLDGSGSWASTWTPLSLDLQVGTLMTPNIEAGADITYADTDIGNTTSTTWAIGGYGRYYFQPTGPLRGWGQARLSWLSQETGPNDDKRHRLGGRTRCQPVHHGLHGS